MQKWLVQWDTRARPVVALRARDQDFANDKRHDHATDYRASFSPIRAARGIDEEHNGLNDEQAAAACEYPRGPDSTGYSIRPRDGGIA